MNRLILYMKVVLGIVLILNLGVAQSAFADPPAPPEPCQTEADWISFEQSVFAYVFGADLTMNDSLALHVKDASGAYEPITSVGLYGGTIFSGQPFTFECSWVFEIPYDCPDEPREAGQGDDEECPFTAEQIAGLELEEVTLTLVVGTLTGPSGSLPIIGLATSGVPVETGQFVSHLVVLNTLPMGAGLLSGRPVPSPAFLVPIVASGEAEAGEAEDSFPMVKREERDPERIPDACEQCMIDYNDRMTVAGATRNAEIASANAVYDSTAGQAAETYNNNVQDAQNRRDDAVRNAQRIRDTALLVATATYVTASLACTFCVLTGPLAPLAFLGCKLAAFAVYGVAVAGIVASCNDAVAAADDTLRSDVAAAEAEANTTLAAAAATRDNSIFAADQAYEVTRAAASLALAVCAAIHNCQGVIIPGQG